MPKIHKGQKMALSSLPTILKAGLLIFIVLALPFNMAIAQEPENIDLDTLYQVSTLEALIVGVYDGVVTFDEVAAHGDFGLGTFDRLDGEMIAVDGEFYRVRVDGVASLVEADETTPFAAVTYFEADMAWALTEDIPCEALQTSLLQMFPSQNLFYAIKIDGTFSALTTRSVPIQDAPYPPLGEVIAQQTTFDFESVEGTMVGLWLPEYLVDVNATGFHFHFLTADRRTGGHVLDCVAQDVTIEVDITDGLDLVLPESDAFLDADLSD